MDVQQRERASTLISQRCHIALSVEVRLRDREAPGFATYPYEAEGCAAGHRHLALGEDPDKAVANLRDWIVNRSPTVAAIADHKAAMQWVLDTAEAIECQSYDGCCGCIDNLTNAVKDSLATQVTA